MINILNINTNYFGGGAAQIARIIHENLNKSKKFSSLFAYGRGNDIDEEEVFNVSVKPEIYIHLALTRTIGLEGYGSFFSTNYLMSLIKKEKIDIIHLHNLHGYYLNLSLFDFLKKTGIPVVWTLHDGWALTGNCAYWFKCYRWKNGCKKCPNNLTYPKNYYNFSNIMWKIKRIKFASGWDPQIVTPSNWLAKQVKVSYLKNHNVRVINNGIDTEKFKRKNKILVRNKLGIKPNKKVLLFVANDLDDERKGAKFFFEAIKYINIKDLLVVTVGKKINKKSKNQREIMELGYVSSQNKLVDIYNSADVFCISSIDDNFPTTVLESLSCGTPVIGYNVGGIPEQINNDCGFVISYKNVKNYAEKTEKLLRNNNLRSKFSINARKRVEKYFSIPKMMKQYKKLYEELVNKQ